MAETWIDTRNGELLVGAEAAADRIDEAGPDIVPLANLLTAEEFPYKNGDFGEAPRRTWNRDELLALGKWVINVLENGQADDEANVHLTTKHIDRLQTLRLLSSRRAIEHHFGYMWRYREALGLEIGKADTRFDDWSVADFVAYGRRLAASLGRKPRRIDYEQADGPSPIVLKNREHIGGVKGLNELLGYINVHDMDEEDFINWGVKVMEANPECGLSFRLADALSRRKVGPAGATIVNRFLRFSVYKKRVTERYEQIQIEKAEKRREKLAELARLEALKLVPQKISDATEDEKLAFIARYWVVRRCLPESNKKMHINTAAMDGSPTPLIRRHHPFVSAGHIEATASMLSVFDDIWPLDDYKTTLRVEPEELKRARAA